MLNQIAELILFRDRMEFFRHCPECGRRFHIKLASKKIVNLDRKKEKTESVVSPTAGGLVYSAASPYLHLQEGPPIIVDIEEFQYVYKCKHCGHEWSEKHTEEHRET